MDKLKLKIPRNLLDLFVDYCSTNKIYEKINSNNGNPSKEKNKLVTNNNFNKYDHCVGYDDPAFAIYFSRRHNYELKNMYNVFNKLNLNAQPYYPKVEKDEEDGFEIIKTKLADIDPNNIKEYIPKNYRIVKNENTNN